MLRVLISCLALMHLSSAAFSRQVNTSSGIVQGYIDPEYPSISQYRAIPFGEPPVGDLRFAAPIAKKYQSSLIDGTSYGSQCLQLGSGKQTGTALKDNPGLFVSSVGHAESAEDCLTLAIWTPTWAIDSCASLPVIIWFFGGGFISGGTDSAYYNGAPWTQRTQEHIVVTFNYRTNIMGTPNAQGLALTNDNLNFGLQDQRLA